MTFENLLLERHGDGVAVVTTPIPAEHGELS